MKETKGKRHWVCVPLGHLFLGTSLDSSLGDLASLFLLLNGFNDSDSHSLSHVTNSETSERWVLSECLNTHRLGWNHLNDSSITRLDEFWSIFNRFTGTTINLLEELGKLAGNVSSVAIQNWSVTSTDLTRVVKNDDLSVEGLGTLWWILLGVTSNVTTTDFLDRDVLDVETNVVTWDTLDELFVMHLNGLDFSGDTSWGKGDDHTGLDDTSLNTTDWHRANTTNLVNILEGKTEGLISWAGRWFDSIESFEKGLAGSLGTSLALLLPTPRPSAVGGDVDHVITVEAGDGNERNGLWVVTDLLDEVGGLLDDFIVTILAKAKASVTANGKPSGTATTMIVTVTMKMLRNS